MSFDLNLICLKNGEFDTFPSIIVQNIFEPFVKKRDEDLWFLEFPDGGGGDMLGDRDERTNGVSIHHASGGDIYDALYEVLRQTNSVLIWSFGGCVIADSAMLAHLPEGLIESVGVPVVVHSGADIVAEIEKT
jgi:hypothetical protein